MPLRLYRDLRYKRLTNCTLAITVIVGRLGARGNPNVWVIAKSHLRRFWESRKDDSEVAQKVLLTWFKLAERADWANFLARSNKPSDRPIKSAIA